MYNYKEKCFEYENDSSIDTWENLYQVKMYVSPNYKIEDYKYRKYSISGNTYKRLHKKVTFKDINITISCSGDCDFNFNKKKRENFEYIINNCEDID